MPRRRALSVLAVPVLAWLLGPLLALSISSCAAHDDDHDVGAEPARRPSVVARGKIQRWPEATAHLRVVDAAGTVTVGLGAARRTGLDTLWSIATTAPGTGFFYGDSVRGTEETRVAYAAAALRVEDIRDASSLAFTRESVGPVPLGGIVVVEHLPTRRYLAIVLEGIAPTDPRTAGAGPYAHADVSWYLTAEGAAGFADPDSAP